MSDNRNFDNSNDVNRAPELEKDARRTVETDPAGFPESDMNKGRRDDEAKLKQKSTDENSQAELEDLATNVRGTVGSRVTGSNSEDIAGIADIDRGLKR